MLAQNIEQHLALAGVCQAAKLVQQTARQGNPDRQAVECCLSSILVTSPDTPQQVFGSLQNLKIGFQTIIDQLAGKNTTKDSELTRYIASILGLERKLAKNSAALNQLSDRINHVQRQLQYVEFDNQQIVSSLASIYSDVISPLAPRIQVSGDPNILGQSINQHRVRALLLAGIRAAVMWRQMGGRRRQILFGRKQIIDSARAAIKLIN